MPLSLLLSTPDLGDPITHVSCPNAHVVLVGRASGAVSLLLRREAPPRPAAAAAAADAAANAAATNGEAHHAHGREDDVEAGTAPTAITHDGINSHSEWSHVALTIRSDEQVVGSFLDEATHEVLAASGDVCVRRWRLDDLRPDTPVVRGARHDVFKYTFPHSFGNCAGTTTLMHGRTVLVIRPRPGSRQVYWTDLGAGGDDGAPLETRVLDGIGPGGADRVYGTAIPCDFDGRDTLWVARPNDASPWRVHVWDLAQRVQTAAFDVAVRGGGSGGGVVAAVRTPPPTSSLGAFRFLGQTHVLGCVDSALVRWVREDKTAAGTVVVRGGVHAFSVVAAACAPPEAESTPCFVVWASTSVVVYGCEPPRPLRTSPRALPAPSPHLGTPLFVRLSTPDLAILVDSVGMHAVALVPVGSARV